ncbi:rab9 effector with kelch motifs-like [Pelobates cultripes]|uniref:Rab9 effector with kelch motifs-like n=1 Tax=Pelobates cultripes TaxID=61616 RepID=A0AAD1WWB2_PELCU|nr:rab9 effector with kelch motifs-like [Pelobates cultripes]
MERVPELYVQCDTRRPPVRLSRSHPCSQNAPCFSAPLPSPLPSQLLVFGMGDWSGLSADGKVIVTLEGGAKKYTLGTLSVESRCFIWECGLTNDAHSPFEEGELRIQMEIQGQKGGKYTGLKQERGKRKRMQEEQENVCPNSGNLNGTTQQKNTNKSGSSKVITSVKGTAAGPTGRWGHALCPIDSKTVILVGGQGTRMQFCKDSMWKLNTEEDTWSPAEALADGPSPEARTGHTAVFDPESQRIYVFGGSKNKKWFNDVHILDTETWKWSSVEARGKVPPLSYHSCSLFRGEMFVFGGVFPRPNPEPDGCSDSLYIFDPEHEIWYQPIIFGEKPSARSGHSACLMRRELYIFGGWDTPVCYNDLYLLDLGLMEFSPVKVNGCSPSPRCWHSAAPVSDTHFLTHGGYDGNLALSDTHVFNTVTKTWTSLVHNSLPRLPRAGHSMLPLPRAKEDKNSKGTPQDLLIFGGGDNEGHFYSDTVRLHLADLLVL